MCDDVDVDVDDDDDGWMEIHACNPQIHQVHKEHLLWPHTKIKIQVTLVVLRFFSDILCFSEDIQKETQRDKPRDQHLKRPTDKPTGEQKASKCSSASGSLDIMTIPIHLSAQPRGKPGLCFCLAMF